MCVCVCARVRERECVCACVAYMCWCYHVQHVVFVYEQKNQSITKYINGHVNREMSNSVKATVNVSMCCIVVWCGVELSLFCTSCLPSLGIAV